MRVFEGIPVSPGVAIGPASILRTEDSLPPHRTVPPSQIDAEIQRYRAATAAAQGELGQTTEQADLPHAVRSIAASHRELLNDPTLLGAIEETIRNGRTTADWAVAVVFHKWIERFRALEDEFFRQRHVDLVDLRRRVLRRLYLPQAGEEPSEERPAILVARDLTPSAVAELKRKGILGLASEYGGATSHSAIVAKSLGIPAVFGLGHAVSEIDPGARVVLDGEQGILVVQPDAPTLNRYRELQGRLAQRTLVLRRISQLPAETLDGWPVTVLGNIEFPFEIVEAVANGADGIGLYRTEFLYAGRTSPPGEEAHLQAYREALGHLRGRPLTIRTFDFGADKFAAELGMPAEANPFLGCRSIRYSFARPDLFRTQLRAILRASAEGRIDLLLPMISSVTELRRACALLDQVKEELHAERIPFNPELRTGVMVEIPAAAVGADLLAREVDFFSIGTNDLTQYTLAVDRTNERVAALFRPGNPAILRLLQQIVREGERAKISVSMCGEMAAETSYALLLLGLGIRQFSVAPALVPQVKRVVRGVARRTAASIARQALLLSTPEDVDAYLADETSRLLGEP
ncbi:MAG: phosphoenolpyruvate--protein phosphotransferase [Planctomycetaceae bacterium]